MTNFNCMFCGDKMEIPANLRGKVNPVTNLFWHEDCIDNPEYELTLDQKIFYHKTGVSF